MGDENASNRLKRWGLTGTFVALGGVLLWSGADLIVARTISRFSPEIEKTLIITIIINTQPPKIDKKFDK